MGNDSPREPIINSKGQIIYGSGLPGAIWQQFMNTVLEGTPKENLPDKPLIDGDTGEGVPEPTTEAPPSTPAPPENPPDPGKGDTDKDGVPDAADPAPNDPNVPNNNEPVDTDGDGVPDA